MNSKDVFMFFTKFGPVEFAKVHNSLHSSYRFAFVTFESRESRLRALAAEEAELTVRGGRVLRVNAARSRENIPPVIKSFTWVRRMRDSEGEGGPSVDQPAQPEVQHPADPQLHLHGQQDGMSSMVPQYLLFNTEKYFEQLFEQPSEQPFFYNSVPYYNPAFYYYPDYPTNVGQMPLWGQFGPTWSRQQFPQYEVENPESHVQNETNL